MIKEFNVYPFDFDSRMVEWNLKHSLITKEQLKKYLDSLPDESQNTLTLEIEETTELNGHAQ